MFSEFRNSYGKNCSSVGRKENTCTAVKLSIAYKVSAWWLPWIPEINQKNLLEKTDKYGKTVTLKLCLFKDGLDN